PVVVNNLTGATSVSAGTHSVAMKNDGTVWSFGSNSNGQLGNGTNANSDVPTQVVNLIIGAQVATPTFSPEGGFYLQAQSVTVSCGSVGATIRYTTDGSEPTAGSQIIASGASISVANTTVLRAKAFRSGYAPSNTKSGVYQIGGYVVSGVSHSLALKPDGTLWSWGYNNYGQLGNGGTGEQGVAGQVVG